MTMKFKVGQRLPFKTYKGGPLTGLLTLKLDGVHVVVSGGKGTSRTGKPLYGLPKLPDGHYECFVDNWSTTVSLLRSMDTAELKSSCFYRLDQIDHRLIYGALYNQEPPEILPNQEGWVVHSPDGLIKVKKKASYDVQVTDWIEGTGKHKGRLGALLTPMGKVGIGFSDKQRDEFDRDLIGNTIEVECLELTEGGKFRMPKFIRLRPDKD